MRRWWGEVSSITLDQGVENSLSVPANKNTVVNRTTRELTELVTVHRGLGGQRRDTAKPHQGKTYS